MSETWAFNEEQITSRQNRSRLTREATPPLTGGGRTYAIALRGRDGEPSAEVQEGIAYSLRTPGGGSSHQLISSTEDFPARTYQLQESGPVLGASVAASGLSSDGSCPNCGHDGSSSRMFPGFYPPVVPEFSPPSFASEGDWLPDGADGLLAGILNGSSSGDLTGLLPLLDELHAALTSEWLSPDLLSSGIAWDGQYWTRSTSESRNAAAACSLSQVLEGEVPSKFYLSAKAAAGILRRAERRGKTLPEHLELALRTLSEAGEAT